MAPLGMTPKERNMVVVLLAGAVLVVLNQTLLSPALPSIMQHLQVDATTVQWLTSAYALTEAVVIPLAAWFMGRFSTRQLYIGGMVLFGVGSLGGALLRDSGLNHFGLEIVAAFDVNPDLVGTALNGIPIYHSDDFEEKMQAYDVNIGVLTVPIEIAQKITDTMVAGGIKAVWNFTPFRIRVPEDIVVQNTSLYAHLAVMFNRLNFNEIR